MGCEWTSTTLSGLLFFANGRTSPERADELPFPVYGSNGIIGYSSQFNSAPNTIVIGRVGSYCGSLYFSTEKSWVTDNAIRANAIGDNYAEFLYYLLTTLDLNHWRAGSGQPLLNQTILGSIPAIVPDAKQQRSIASILSSLDDRIALLRETNTTLEAIAQAIFKSWFVDFDPVKAKAEGREPDGMDADTAALFPSEFDESELGMIPKGWETRKIETILNRLSAKVRYTKNQVEPFGVTPVFEQGAGILLGYHNGNAQFKATPDDPAFIFGDHTYVTRLSCEPFDISQNVIPLKGSDRSTLWVYYALKDKQTFQEYRRHWMELACKDIIVPPVSSCKAFADVVSNIHLRIEANIRESQTLASLRDILLPRPMSGQLRVPEAEQMVEGTA